MPIPRKYKVAALPPWAPYAITPAAAIVGGVYGNPEEPVTGGLHGAALGTGLGLASPILLQRLLPHNRVLPLAGAALGGFGLGAQASRGFKQSKDMLDEQQRRGVEKRQHNLAMRKFRKEEIARRKEAALALPPPTVIDVTSWAQRLKNVLGQIGRKAKEVNPYPALVPAGMVAGGAIPAAMIAPEGQRLETGAVGADMGLTAGALVGSMGLHRLLEQAPFLESADIIRKGRRIPIAALGAGTAMGALMGLNAKRNQEAFEEAQAKRDAKYEREKAQRAEDLLAMAEKTSGATLTWGMQKDPRALPRMAPGMYSFGGTKRILPSDKPGFYKPPTPGFDG